MLAIANQDFLNQNVVAIRKFVKKGELRAILVDPSGNAMKMVSNLSYGYEKETESMEGLIGLCKNQMKEFYRISEDNKKVELRLVDHLPFAIILLCQINHPFRRLMLVLFSKRFEVMPPLAVDLSVM